MNHTVLHSIPRSGTGAITSPARRVIVQVARTRIILLVICTFGTPWLMSQAHAQNPAGKGRLGRADAEWAQLAELARRSAQPAARERRTRDQHAAAQARQVDAALRTAGAARAFALAYPGDSRVREARKIEALSRLRAVTRDDVGGREAAFAVAREYRDDPAMPERDRFEVAVAMDTHDMVVKLRSGAARNRAVEQKRMVAAWRQEFGDTPEIQEYAIRAARRADPRLATELASQVMRSTAATLPHQQEARVLVERAMLLGKPISLTVPLLDGGEFDLSQQEGYVTVIVIWSPLQPESLEPLKVFQRRMPQGVRIVSLALGGTIGDVERARPRLPVVTHFAHVPIGPSATQAARALKLQLAPYIYIINKSGVLSDFGLLSEVRAVFTRAGVTATRAS